MFKKIQVPLRAFYCELKHREPDDVDGSSEELIEVLDLQVPRLKNSDMEKQWCFTMLWNKIYEPEYADKGINQIFIFTAEAGELLARLEVNQFTDEPARRIEPPNPTVFKRWQKGVEKQFKKLYGVSIEQWQQTE